MQQQGGSQYGVPPMEMVPQFTSAAAGPRQPRMMGIHGGADHLQHLPAAEAASPISSRSAPQPQVVASRSPGNFFDELGSGGGGAVTRSVPEEGAAPGTGGEGESGGGAGSRWPRQETLTLLKIRSEMDAIFRDATLKGPLWEDVSRKMAELGFKRSAKKCKEKFENVHKYYKRTKEGRAGRQDGKSYRFFSQLEALHSTTTPATVNINSLPPLNADAAPPAGASIAATPVDGVQPPPPQLNALEPDLPPTAAAARISFSSNTSSSSSDSDGEDTDEGGAGEFQEGGRKRKRQGWPCGSGKTMAFFEGLIKQLMERQEAMQQQFLETIEKREQDRMVREEAWKRQEMARLNREYELMAQERTMTANRDAAVISFLQKFTGGATNPPNQLLDAAAVSAPLPRDPSPEEPPPAGEDQPMSQRSHQVNEIVIHQPSSSAEMAPEAIAGGCADVVSLSSSKSLPSSRWPKAEVIALIKLRSGLEVRYQDSGPKGPLWEEISLEMKRLGYNRSTKRCKEKWENINKYFKKVKEGNKKRPVDAKTCPYFHELDALYIKKQLQQDTTDTNAVAPPISAPAEQASDNGGHRNPAALRSGIGNGGNHEGSGFQMPRSNANGHFEGFFGGAPNSASDALLKKPEDIVRELMERQNHEEEDDDDVDDDDYEDDEEEEDGKLRYEIQFQSQSVVGGAAGGPRGGNAAANAAASAPPSSNAGSFLAMVQ